MKIGFNRQPSPTKLDRQNSKRTTQTNTNSASSSGKGRGGSGKSSTSSSGRPNTGNKENTEKPTIDTSKPHWILRIVSDADKAV